MILNKDLYPNGIYRVLIPLLLCLTVSFAAGCTQKPKWKPPEERVATPPPEPPPKVELQVFYVAADRLNLRACPGMDCPRISMLGRNQQVEKVGESQGWFQVRSRQDGTLGWVDARYLASTPVADSVALPSETVQPKETKPTEPKPKVKAHTPILEEESEEAPRKRRKPAAEAAEPPPEPAAEPAQETPAAPAPAAPSDSGKKKIRIM